MSVIRVAKPGRQSASGWLLQLLERKPRKLAAGGSGQQDGPGNLRHDCAR
jgi:hypothetical protein